MQIFLFGALAISLIAVVFALQNIVPVTVTFLNVQFEGSLALVLFVAFVAGALVSFLASLPTLARNRWTSRDLHRQVTALEAELARRPTPPAPGPDPSRATSGSGPGADPRPGPGLPGPSERTTGPEGGRGTTPLEPRS